MPADRSFDLIQRGKAWADEFADPLRDPEALLALPEATLYKRGRSGRIVGAVEVAGVSLVLKLFDETPLRRVVERLILGSGARRVARTIERLEHLGLPVPGLVAVLERRRQSCVVTRFVTGGQRADYSWEELAADQREPFLFSLGSYAGTLHRLGIYPQDTRPANLITRRDENGWHVVLVDLDRVRFYRNMGERRREKILRQVRTTFPSATSEELAVFQSGYEAARSPGG